MASKGFTQTALVSLTVGETERGRMGVMESVSTRPLSLSASWVGSFSPKGCVYVSRGVRLFVWHGDIIMKITNYSGVQLSKTSQIACFSSPRPLAAFVHACAVDACKFEGSCEDWYNQVSRQGWKASWWCGWCDDDAETGKQCCQQWWKLTANHTRHTHTYPLNNFVISR